MRAGQGNPAGSKGSNEQENKSEILRRPPSEVPQKLQAK